MSADVPVCATSLCDARPRYLGDLPLGLAHPGTHLLGRARALLGQLAHLVRDDSESEPVRSRSRSDSESSRTRDRKSHTSELQSRLHLVCRLLLEKKKHTPYN